MLLKKIILNNFRQFYGKQTLDIASGSDINVTLIHGENGVGKTTVLNAVLWCFYKDTTHRFEKPDKITNYQAISEGDNIATVEVFFENEGCDYLVSRTLNEHSQEEDFKAFIVENGNFKNLDSPNVFINSVIPREMAKYFFFDGEYAENFSSQNNKSTVRDALEDMLGCKTANQAIKDLHALKSEFEKQVSALTKGNNVAELMQKQIDSLETANKMDEAKVIQLENTLETAKSARDDITEKLRNAEGASAIQKKREELERLKSKILEQKLKSEAALSSWIGESGLGLISKKLEENTQAIIDDAKIKGKLPSDIGETFVNDILDKKICICNREFEEESSEAESIKKLLDDAGNAAATDRLMNARSLMGVLLEKRSHALDSLNLIREQIKGQSDELDAIEAKIADCHAQLQGSKIQEIAEREMALKKRHEEIEDLTGQINKLKFDCENRKEDIEKNKKKRDQALQTNERAIGLQKRCLILSKTAEKIEQELVKYREESRNKIAEEVNKILDKTARRDYYATIDDKFNLDMFYKETRTSVARSGGENQLLSLAFIAALIQFSSDRIENQSELLRPGTLAPMVLDSPFGQLDPTYQQATAGFLPKMAKQVVLLLSKTQGNSDVMGILKDRIGAEYVLISENSAPQGEKPSDIIMINGEEIYCSRYNCEKDFTRIEKIEDKE